MLLCTKVFILRHLGNNISYGIRSCWGTYHGNNAMFPSKLLRCIAQGCFAPRWLGANWESCTYSSITVVKIGRLAEWIVCKIFWWLLSKQWFDYYSSSLQLIPQSILCEFQCSTVKIDDFNEFDFSDILSESSSHLHDSDVDSSCSHFSSINFVILHYRMA